MIDTQAIRAHHVATNLYGDGKKPVCRICRIHYPCDAIRLCDEVERLKEKTPSVSEGGRE